MRLAVVFGKFTYEDSNQKEFLIFMILKGMKWGYRKMGLQLTRIY